MSALPIRDVLASQAAPSRVLVLPSVAGASHSAISVEITTAIRFASLKREWRNLADRALEPNAFMEPSLVCAAALAGKAPIHVLLAWGSSSPGGPIRLLGAWALACCRPSSGLPVTVMKAPVHDHAFLGIPVLDHELGGQALDCMLDQIAREPDLPKILEVASLDEGGQIGRLFVESLARRRASIVRLDPRLRPQLQLAHASPQLSGSRAKALRQRRRRLDRLGEVTCTSHVDQADVVRALGELLILEAAGWKGRTAQRGRAILRDEALERFFRRTVEDLAADGLVTLTALRCAGRPVAMQLTIRSGTTAFTWKTAYDENFKNCAPGIILLQRITEDFITEKNLHMVDSCNHRDDGYMAEFWSDRRKVTDVLFDVRQEARLSTKLVCAVERVRRDLLAQARRLRAALRRDARTLRASVETFPAWVMRTHSTMVSSIRQHWSNQTGGVR